MQLLNVDSDGVKTDISQLVASGITWSGDVQQVARKLDIVVSKPQFDYYIPKVDIKPGSLIQLLNDNSSEIFQGHVFSRSKTARDQSQQVSCYDSLIYLTKNQVYYNFKNTTAESITARVCNDFGIGIGSIASTGIPQSFVVFGKTIYETIMIAYTNVSKQTGKKYIPVMRNGKLSVIEKGATVCTMILDPNRNIVDSNYTESIENMVNLIKIYTESGTYISEVSNTEWMKLYGTLQVIYKQEENVNPKIGATRLLQDVERTCSITINLPVDYIECVTGNAVKVQEPYTGLVGLFYIDGDTHKWENNVHTAELTLSFQNMMDEQEAEKNAE